MGKPTPTCVCGNAPPTTREITTPNPPATRSVHVRGAMAEKEEEEDVIFKSLPNNSGGFGAEQTFRLSLYDRGPGERDSTGHQGKALF